MALPKLNVFDRLEAATSRLEDLVPDMGNPPVSINGAPLSPSQSLSPSQGIEQVRGAVQSAQKHLETLPPVIDDFDATINGEVKTFVNMSEEIGGLVAEQVLPLRSYEVLGTSQLLTITR